MVLSKLDGFLNYRGPYPWIVLYRGKRPKKGKVCKRRLHTRVQLQHMMLINRFRKMTMLDYALHND